MSLLVTLAVDDGRTVSLTPTQAKSIEALTEIRKGGCASVKGYKPVSNWIKSPTHDIQLITRFSTRKLYQRRLKALEAVKYEDVAVAVAKDEKLNALSGAKLLEHFDARKQKLIDSLTRSLEDKPKNAHQEAHERCYAYIDGVKIHLVTETVNKVKQPVLDRDGHCMCASVMIPYLELHVKEVVPGERKIVNSGPAVLMGNIIESCLNQRSVNYKTLSLKSDNFTSFRVDNNEFLPEHIATYGEVL